jgi:electron transfer flavoprotein alpha subunit
MSKVLVVAFAKHEIEAGAAFANALGMPFDVVEVPRGALADAASTAVAGQASGYSHIAAVSSMAAKDVMARVAGLLDAPMVTDAIAVENANTFKRPIVAGTLIETVEVQSPQMVVTFRPAGFSGSGAPGEVRELAVGESKAKRDSESESKGGRPDLTQAKVIVSGGKPLKDAQTFEEVIGGLADALGGAVGATRAAVDSGIAPNDLQVGQTGKIVAPDLYIAAGISGSTQHMAGIKDSKIIVAINKDPEAPIFEFADFGLVADLFVAIPEFRKEIGK